MRVAPFGVCLPEFDHRVWNRTAFSVQHTKGEPHTFAFRSIASDARNTPCVGEAKMQVRTYGLRRCRRQIHRCLSLIIFTSQFFTSQTFGFSNGVDSWPRSTMSKR